MKSLKRNVVGLRSCDIFWVIPAKRCSRYVQYLRGKCVIMLGFPPVMYQSSNGGGYLRCSHICADPVATGKVNYYNCIVRVRSLPNFTETIGQGYSGL